MCSYIYLNKYCVHFVPCTQYVGKKMSNVNCAPVKLSEILLKRLHITLKTFGLWILTIGNRYKR